MYIALAGTIVAAVLMLPAGRQAPPPVTPNADTTAGSGNGQRTGDTKSSVTLNGCISEKPTSTGSFTFEESAGLAAYRLTGKGIRKFAGKRVEIVGGTGKRGLSIKGGLLPSPNIAAQAGAIDPAQAAIASQPGGATSGTGPAALPEFHVVKLRGVDGACQ